jgi:hypothetical protein
MDNQIDSNTLEEQGQEQIADSTPTQEDIFDDVFNLANDDPFVQEVSDTREDEIIQNEPLSTSDNVEAKENDSQFQYWQSQADKNKAEVAALRAEMDALKQTSAKVEEEIKEPTLVKPTKPVRPGNYDISEALADPDSSSAKYMVEKENYMENMSDYLMNQDENRQRTLQAQAEKQMAQQQHQETLVELQGRHGYTPEQASDFIQSMSSPDSLSLDNLVKLHQLNMGNIPQLATQQQQVAPQAQQKANQMKQRSEKLSIPKPIGVQQGQSVQSPNKSTEDVMMDAMVDDFNKTNIF